VFSDEIRFRLKVGAFFAQGLSRLYRLNGYFIEHFLYERHDRLHGGIFVMGAGVAKQIHALPEIPVLGHSSLSLSVISMKKEILYRMIHKRTVNYKIIRCLITK